MSRRITSEEEREKKKERGKEREKINLHEQKKAFHGTEGRKKNHGEKVNFEPEPKTEFSGSRIKENRERKK